MDPGLDEKKVERSISFGSENDPVDKLLTSKTAIKSLRQDEKQESPIFECVGSEYNMYKVLAWSLPVLIVLASLFLFRASLTSAIFWLISCSIAFAIAIRVQVLKNKSYVKIFDDRIEWCVRGQVLTSSIYSARLPRSHSRIVIEDVEGKQLGILPDVLKADTISILAALSNLGRSPKLPSEKTWLAPTLKTFTYETYQINWLRIIAMTLVGFGPLVSLSLAFLTALPVWFWILPLPIALILSFILGRAAAKLTSRNRYEFTASSVKKFKSGQEIWSVDLDEVRHVGFAALVDSCQFVLVTHYGRKYLLPPAWNVVLPFAVWRGLKLVKDEEMQAELVKPISFKRSGL